MKRSITWFIMIVVVLGAWYLSSSQTNTGTPAVLAVANNSELGDYLVASNGMTLYRYANDTANVSNCSGTCAVNWPPYSPTTNESLIAGNGVTGTLNTITRGDGIIQLTYNNTPLYFWKNDQKTGDTTGQNVGSIWFVVKP